MFEKAKLTALATALGLTMAIALLASPLARADQNPFSVSDAASGIVVAGEEKGKCAEGKCAEGKCGGGEEEEGEAKCGDDEKEGKCGEGKCGGKEE
jgi:uncharacterized low-complexity protein